MVWAWEVVGSVEASSAGNSVSSQTRQPYKGLLGFAPAK